MADEDRRYRDEGLALKTLIEKADRPRKELTKVLNCSLRTLGKTLSGRRAIPDPELSLLLKTLGVPRPRYDTLVAYLKDEELPGTRQADAEVEFEVTVKGKQTGLDQSYRLSEPDIRIQLRRSDADGD